MIKLSDIIKSGGGNAKINRFINRYVINKKEKKDIIKEIKNSKGGSSDVIYVGLKKPFLDNEDISDISLEMLYLNLGSKYTNACYNYYAYLYGYENFYNKEYVIAIAVPVIPEFSNNIENNSSFYTFSQLRDAFLSWGYTEEEFDENFYEISKEEFFTPSPEVIDKLTLEFDNHKLVVDFHKNTYEKDGVVSEIVDNIVPPFTGLTSVSHSEVVLNNVKYETNINNYVEYYHRISSDVYYHGRIKVNGVGPDPNYDNMGIANGYRHSSGIIVAVIE